MDHDPETENLTAQSETESSATVVATRLKLSSWRNLRRFFRVNRAVERQLKADPDLISYRLRADFIRLQFSTISIWSGEAAIDRFVRTGNHLIALQVFDDIAIRDQSAFVRWNTTNPQEVTWSECRRRLASFGQSS
ncbi:MAG: hypothetical protein OXH38_01170 [Chloroflexi bacterium]|nr:hypothetical protein [Chloroflexota bacterium]